MIRALAIVLIGSALAAVACGDDSATEAGAGDGVTASREAEGSSTVLGIGTSDLGEILVDGDGRTLYLFTPDDGRESTCYDACEASWPIVTEVDGVGEGLDASLLGQSTRTTGDVQATYNGWPLYRFIGDAAPGDTTGQGLQGIWWVIDASGDPIETADSVDEPPGRGGY